MKGRPTKQLTLDLSKSDRELARELGVAKSTVIAYRRRNGIPNQKERRREAFARLYDKRLRPCAIVDMMRESGNPISRTMFYRLERELHNH